VKKLEMRDGCFLHPDTYEPLQSVQVIIVDGGTLSRNYYEGTRLSCWSIGCDFPDKKVPPDTKQANRCLDCVQSIKTAHGGAACKYFTRIKVAFTDSESIYELRLNALSLFSKADNRMTLYKYEDHLARNGEHVSSVLTEIYLAPYKDFYKVYFKPVRPLIEGELADVKRLIEAADKQDKETYMANEYYIKNVKAIYPRLDQTYHFSTKLGRSAPCDPSAPGAAFDLHFEMTAEQSTHLGKAIFAAYKDARKDDWAAKPKNPFKTSLGKSNPIVAEGDNKIAKAKLSGVLGGEVMSPPAMVDAKLNPLPANFKLTTGSIVNLVFALSPYSFAGQNGVTLRLKQVQVIKYIPYVPPAAEQFEEEEGFVFDGAAAPAPAVEKEPATEEDMFDGVEEEDEPEVVKEPVKRKKKQEVEADDDDDIEDIIAEWGTED